MVNEKVSDDLVADVGKVLSYDSSLGCIKMCQALVPFACCLRASHGAHSYGIFDLSWLRTASSYELLDSAMLVYGRSD